VSGTLIVRADASVSMGAGHVMRCLALAQAWQDDGGDVVFVMAQTLPALVERLETERFGVVCLNNGTFGQDATQFLDVARAKRASWIVLDGYHFHPEYQQAIKGANLNLLLLDDGGQAKRYFADLVLDQNFRVAPVTYESREPSTRLLVGTSYAMLRREFFSLRNQKRDSPRVARKILITMGGSDADNLTLGVMRLLVQIKELEVVAVVGDGNPHLQVLKRCASESAAEVRIVKNVMNMAELMAWADLAIIAAGGTLWELLCVGCPVLSFARNSLQAGILSSLDRSQVVHFLGYAKAFNRSVLATTIGDVVSDPLRRARMSERGRNMIDGRGAERVCKILQEKQ